MKINDLTKIEVNKELLNEDVLIAYLKDLQIVLIQSYSWLAGLPGILAKNDKTKKEDKENIEKLMKEKERIEANIKELEDKILFFKSIYGR